VGARVYRTRSARKVLTEVHRSVEQLSIFGFVQVIFGINLCS
jgi:hypothetical protein